MPGGLIEIKCRYCKSKTKESYIKDLHDIYGMNIAHEFSCGTFLY